MDKDIALISQLSARVGMIMEDMSPIAITLVARTGPCRTDALISLARAGHTISALVAAALALDERLER